MVASLALNCYVVDCKVRQAFGLNLHVPLLFQDKLLLEGFLVAVASVKQFSSLLSCDVRQFLRSLLLKGKSLDSILEGLVLGYLVLEDLLLLSLLDAGHGRGAGLVGEATPAELVHANGARPKSAAVQRWGH